MSGIIGQDLQVKSGLFGFPAGHVLQTKIKSLETTNDGSNYISTNVTTGAVATFAGSNLEITGFSATSGNHLFMTFNGLSHTGDSPNHNGILGFIVDGTKYSTSLFSGAGTSPMSPQLAITLSSDLSNATISAMIGAPNSSTKYGYIHDYASLYPHTVCSLIVMEIQA